MSRVVRIGLALTAVLVIAGGGGLLWFFQDDAPAPVSLEAATERITTAETSPSSTVGTQAARGVAGTWAVDNASGDFDFDSATGTFVGFRIEEELARIGSATAVGRTGAVTGLVSIDDASTVIAASFEIDLTTITTNDARRDGRVRSALETDEHPTATFTLLDPIDLGSDVVDGSAVSVLATGDLTIHGITRTVEFPLDAQLVADTIVIVGSVDIAFDEYEVEVPSSPAVLSVEDHGILELQVLLTRS